MIRALPNYDPDAPIVVIDIGNTATKVATWHEERLKSTLAVKTDDAGEFEAAFTAHVQDTATGRPAATVISSVVPKALVRIMDQVEAIQSKPGLVVGDGIPLPLDFDVDDPKTVGVDRVCEAYAAYEKLEKAVTVVSFGSAVTVDLVDDEGTFLGGAILPGVRMQLRALREFTAQLPQVEPEVPELPYGRNTAQAMQNGVCRGIAGAVRGLVEAYATKLNRWPHVVGTGGDMAMLIPHCDFIDTVVADLVLRGAALAYRKHLVEMGA